MFLFIIINFKNNVKSDMDIYDKCKTNAILGYAPRIAFVDKYFSPNRRDPDRKYASLSRFAFRADLKRQLVRREPCKIESESA